MFQGRRRQPGLGVMLLFYQLFGVIGIDRLPPVTLGAIGLQVAIFLRLFKLPWYNAGEICVSAYRVLRLKQYSRLLFAAFEHGDDWHLYYNMVSFALKGQSLERRLGSVKFLYIISVFTVLTNSVLVALNELSSKFLGDSDDHCAVGFSGVIFALKVLTTYYNPSNVQQIMGMPVIMPSKYAVWAELVLIQLFVPNVSFYGHLAGILVGMAYVMGPLKYFMDLFYSLVKRILFPPSPRFTSRAEPSGYSSGRFTEYVPSGMTEEEQLRRAMEESIRANSRPRDFNSSPYYTSTSNSSPPPPGFIFDDNNYSSPPPAGFYPDIEELRTRREAHFYH